jgi:hypothetical protein
MNKKGDCQNCKQSQTTENTVTQIDFFHTLKGMWDYTAIEHF